MPAGSRSSFRLVEQDVAKLLSGKSHQELETLADEISFRLDNCSDSIDTEFMWAALDWISTIVKQPAGSATVRATSQVPSTGSASSGELYTREEEYMLQVELQKGLDEGEEVFKSKGQDFVKPERSRYGSNPPFVPRVPKFFAKVKSTVVWNKYAQTHYDEDSPPPKQVIGYKFTIFYPDLIDKTVTPKYRIEQSDTVNTIVVRFMAAAPYEDLVFKIVNKEWDLHRRSGFFCQFGRGVLQLNFVFKKERYRR